MMVGWWMGGGWFFLVEVTCGGYGALCLYIMYDQIIRIGSMPSLSLGSDVEFVRALYIVHRRSSISSHRWVIYMLSRSGSWFLGVGVGQALIRS